MMELTPDEKHIVAAALLAMCADCPADEQVEFGLIIGSIANKIGAGDAINSVLTQAEVAQAGSGQDKAP